MSLQSANSITGSLMSVASTQLVQTLQLFGFYQTAAKDGLFEGTFEQFVEMMVGVASRLEV